MLKIQIDWISLAVSVMVPLVLSVYFFFAHLQQRRRINQLREEGWITLKELGRKKELKRRVEFVAGLSLFFSIILLLFSLVMAGRILKLF